MPYGLSKKSGGDNPVADAKMERCVQALVSQGKDKVTAIRICKVAIQRSALKNRSSR